MVELNPSMKLTDMKKVLQQGRDRSMFCAYGGTKAGMALLLDVRRQGRMLQTELQSSQPNLQAAAFGTAFRDDDDAAHLKFRVNKGVEGHATKLAKTLRGTGVKRVTILLDEDKFFETAKLAEDDDAPAQVIPGQGPGPQMPQAPSQEAVHADLARVAGLLQSSALQPAQKVALATTLRTAKESLDAGHPDEAALIIAGVERGVGGAGPAAPARPAAALPAANPAMQGLGDALRAAGPDIKSAEATPDTGNFLAADKQALAAALDRVRTQRTNQDFAGARVSVGAARKAAVAIKGKSLLLAGQKETYDRMDGPLAKVRSSYFTKVANDAVRDAKLKPGKEFQAYLATLTEFEKTPTPDMADELDATARAYLAHYAQLGSIAKGSKESKRKKEICETAVTQARHMKMALQVKAAGPPPWDEKTALAMSSIRAAFSFETMGEKAEILPDGDSGVSASFWVKGWDDGSSGADTGKKDFLFKPAAGESSVAGFKKGGSTPREAVTKSLTDKIGVMTGLNLGVPNTSVVAVAPEAVDLETYNTKVMVGRKEKDRANYEIDTTQPAVGSLQQFAASKGSLMDKDAAFFATIPQSECEKNGVLDILCLNTDRHPGNFMVGEQDGPSGKVPKLIPIDHGLALPTREGMRLRGGDRMNDMNGNVLLKMPGSHKPFSQEMQERLSMLDPDAIERGINETIDAVDQAHPTLNTKTHMPPDTAFMAKRSARFLKRACSRLSPAMVQMALANCQADIFDSRDDQFDARADAVIADYEQQAAAIEDLCINLGSDFDLVEKLNKLGWHNLSTNFVSDYKLFKVWFAANATVAMAAYHNDTPWPGQPPKPVA